MTADRRFWLLSALVALLGCGSRPGVAVTIVDAQSQTPVPAMIAIVSEEGRLHLPPDGRVYEGRGSERAEFMEGFEPGTVGPVRLMRGPGDNRFRSAAYGDAPALPWWSPEFSHHVTEPFTIDLPPGRYQLHAARGVEHVPVRKDFEVAPDERLDLRVEVRRWTDLADRGWTAGDVHVHHPTDRRGSREFLLDWARAVDLQVMHVLTMGTPRREHFEQALGRPFCDPAGAPCLVTGQEDPRGNLGHLTGLAVREVVRDLERWELYDEALAGIAAQGGLTGLAHFAAGGPGTRRGAALYAPTVGFDFVELLQFGEARVADYDGWLSLGLRSAVAAGSDLPWGSVPGEARTYVFTGERFSPQGWLEGLREGRSFVTNGPMLEFEVEGALPGSALRVTAGAEVGIEVRASSHPALCELEGVSVRGPAGEVAAWGPAEGREILGEALWGVDRSAWLAASATCANGAAAYTSPVFLEVPGRALRPDGAFLDQQLAILAELRAEVETRAPHPVREALLERLDRAQDVYERLRGGAVDGTAGAAHGEADGARAGDEQEEEPARLEAGEARLGGADGGERARGVCPDARSGLGAEQESGEEGRDGDQACSDEQLAHRAFLSEGFFSAWMWPWSRVRVTTRSDSLDFSSSWFPAGDPTGVRGPLT